MTIQECKDAVGHKVVYTPTMEYGTITSCNDSYAFVRYFGDTHSKATKPSDLELDC